MESEKELNIESLVEFSVKKGIILGIGSCIYLVLVYIIDYSYLAKLSSTFLVLLVLVLVVVIFGNQYRKANSGYLPFGQAFKLSFIILLVSTLIQLIFSMLLYHVIDPDLPALITESVLANWENTFRSLGMDQGQIDEQMRIMARDLPKQFQLVNQLKNSWIIILSSAFFALIAGAIIKRNQPIIDRM